MTASTARAAIIQAAQEEGVDPSSALAIAERESNFNPNARSSKTIRGLFQMRGDLRNQYGIGDSSDPYTQAKGWARFFNDTKRQMSDRLGRDVSDSEAYAGHHFGAGRAARMFGMDPSTPVNQVFTGQELSENPHLVRAGNVGNVLSSVTSDIDRRRANYGGEEAPQLDYAQFEEPEAPQLDYGSFESAEQPSTSGSSTAALDYGQFEAV